MLLEELLEKLIEEPDLDHIYELFSASYLKATGKVWTKDKFLSRAYDWKFYGSETGMIAVRPQKSGFVKLVGAAGAALGIAKGLKEVMAMKVPLWGMVSGNLRDSLVSAGMISPPAWLIKTLMKLAPKNTFTSADFQMNDDGSVTIGYSDVGEATKFFVGSKEYFKKLVHDAGDRLPLPAKLAIQALV